ncbi:MAG: Ig-like domain-containing protein [Gemmatimonadota bacterium]|nr:Ig-like domain-containing protein [Gemmatimonadota bacterium]
MRLRHQILRTTVAVVALVAGCGGSEPTLPAVSVKSVTVNVSSSQLEVAATQTATADVRDTKNAVVTDKAVTWASSAPAIATVSATGLITAVAPGVANVTASVDGKSGQASILVVAPRVTSIVLTQPIGPILPGQTVALVATLKDRNGAVITGRAIAWTSSKTRVATVDGSGAFKALAGGTVTITATVDDVDTQLTVVVSPPPGTTVPTVTSVSPATLTPGITATITGTSFDPAAAQDYVEIAGVVAVVTAATTTQLTVQVPPSGLPCASTQPVNVDVSTIAGTGTKQQPLTVATTRSIAVGATFMAIASGNPGCNELTQSGTYIVSVFNAGTAQDQTEGFAIRGVPPGPLASLSTQPDVLRSIVLAAPTGVRRAPVDPVVAAATRAHLQHLEADIELFHRLGKPRGGTRASRSPSAASEGTSSFAPVPLTVGANTPINFNYSSCTTDKSPVITARVVYVGPKAIVLEDNASVFAGKIDADMIDLAQEFENVSYPLLLNFGNPLAWDDSTDQNGRIIILFTPRVNTAGTGILGFVQLCDLYNPADFAGVNASNKAEIFYARAVTDTLPSNTTLNGRAQWRRQMPATLIHEAKHITSNAERFADPRPAVDEEVWLEEATAQVASELYGRAIHGNKWRGNATYTGTLDCEVRPGTPACGIGEFVMGNHFLYLADYLQSIEQKTILSGSDDNDIYGSAWMFVRWLTDTYATATEGDFLRSIVKSVTTKGVVNVTTPSGKSWPELLSQFTLMLAADDLPNVSPPNVEQSWNLPGVFSGYNRDLQNPPPASPLAIRQATYGSAFQATTTLKGGGAMLIKINGTPGATTSQVLDLHALDGSALGATSKIGIAVLRIK